MTILSSQREAIARRNGVWRNHSGIPEWVDIDTVPLDQFYTRPHIAQKCHRSLVDFIETDGGQPLTMTFLEPSAGTGAFSSLLPEGRSISLDIMPQTPGTLEADFLTWEPLPTDMPIATIGNPPFGYRAWLALQFLNRAAEFSDYVGFILPMAFQSEGKGSPKLRVRGMHLVHSEILPRDSFEDGNGKIVKVNALWQIWKRGEKAALPAPTCESWVELFTVDQRKERLCGQERMADADFFLQRTFYNAPPTIVEKFSDVKYVCGYGIVIKREHERVTAALASVDWREYSNLAAHNCHHVSMYHIRRALTDLGFIDD